MLKISCNGNLRPYGKGCILYVCQVEAIVFASLRKVPGKQTRNNLPRNLDWTSLFNLTKWMLVQKLYLNLAFERDQMRDFRKQIKFQVCCFRPESDSSVSKPLIALAWHWIAWLTDIESVLKYDLHFFINFGFLFLTYSDKERLLPLPSIEQYARRRDYSLWSPAQKSD